MRKLNATLVIISAIASAAMFPSLPAELPMHWNIAGEIDNWMPKNQAVWFFPLITGAMWLLFQVLPKLDPKKKKYALLEKEWNILQTGLIGFFLYLQLITFYIGLNPAVPMMPYMFTGLGILFILLGNYLSKIRQNYFIGIKTPWTPASEDNWNKTHRFGSWWFVTAGIAAIIEALSNWHAPEVIFGLIMLAAFMPIGYSFWVYRKESRK